MIAFASFRRRPISGCLREGGEVTTLGIPELELRAQYLGVLKLGDRDVENRGWGDEWEGLQGLQAKVRTGLRSCVPLEDPGLLCCLGNVSFFFLAAL